MTRRWLIPVLDWAVLQETLWYLLRVLSVEKSGDPPALRVVLEFLEDEHVGQTHVALLRLPIRPAGPSAEFFTACGTAVVAGGTVAPKDALGARVRAQFAKGPSGEWHVVRFAAVADEDATDKHESRA